MSIIFDCGKKRIGGVDYKIVKAKKIQLLQDYYDYKVNQGWSKQDAIDLTLRDYKYASKTTYDAVKKELEKLIRLNAPLIGLHEGYILPKTKIKLK